MNSNVKLYADMTDAGLSAMIRDILTRESGSREGQATYLRTLVAATQIELGGEPVTAPSKGRVRKIGTDSALEAIKTVNDRFYGLVLAELSDLDPKERNSRSNFARTAVGSFRSAVRVGLNPMSCVLSVTSKEWLRAFTRQHRKETELTAEGAVDKARALVRNFGRLLDSMDDGAAKVAALEAAHQELAALDAIVQYVPEDTHRRTHIIPTRARSRREARAAA